MYSYITYVCYAYNQIYNVLFQKALCFGLHVYFKMFNTVKMSEYSYIKRLKCYFKKIF